MKFDILNTSFAIKDTIRLAPEGITFDHIHISDMEGHQGRMNGYLHYEHFKNIKYQFDIQVNNMLVMNTQESPDFPFYGTVYATGNALLAGNAQDGLDANIARLPTGIRTLHIVQELLPRPPAINLLSL